MKHFKNIKVVVISLFLTLLFTSVKAQHTYISNYKDIAAELSGKYGIPSSIILSVAFVESGGGTSKSSKMLNNHFGIVGKNTVNTSRYKSFSSVRESYEAFCQMITRKKYYTRLKGTSDHLDWLKAIASSGYSTQPTEWVKKITHIIYQFGLHK